MYALCKILLARNTYRAIDLANIAFVSLGMGTLVVTDSR